MTAYLRLLDHLAIHVEPWGFLSEACLLGELSCLHSLALDADVSDRRGLFHRALLRCRREEVVGPFFELARRCEPGLEPALGRMVGEVFEQPAPPPAAGFIGRSEEGLGSFELVVDTGDRALDIGAIDRWITSLTRDGRIGRLRLVTARCLSVGTAVGRGRTVLQLECTAADFTLLWNRVQTGRMARVGSLWINGMGRFHAQPDDGLDEVSEVVQFVITEQPRVTEAVRFGTPGQRASG